MQIKFYFSEMFAFDMLHDKKGLIDHTQVTTSKNVPCTDMWEFLNPLTCHAQI